MSDQVLGVSRGLAEGSVIGNWLGVLGVKFRLLTHHDTRSLNPYSLSTFSELQSIIIKLLEKQNMASRLEQLLKKQEELKAQIRKEKNKLVLAERKKDTRRQILLGALMMELMKKGELDEKKIMKRLDSFLTKELDRQLFDLPEQNQKK